MQQRLEIQPAQVTLRLVTRQSAAGGGAIQALGSYYLPSRAGINGERGWSEGTYERRLGEEAPITLTFANGAGEDGQMHRDRFAIIRNGKLTPQGGNVVLAAIGGGYRPGDEFIEIWRSQAVGAPGDLLAVMAITSATITPASIVLNGFDALWLLKKTRAPDSDWWHHSPRDAFAYYTQAWTAVLAQPFNGLSLPAGWTQLNIGNVGGTYSYSYSANGASLGVTTVNLDTNWQQATITTGLLVDSSRPFQVQTTVSIPTLPGPGISAEVGLELTDNSGNLVAVRMNLTNDLIVGTNIGLTYGRYASIKKKGQHTISVLSDGRWLRGYVDGVLLAVVQIAQMGLTGNLKVRLETNANSGGNGPATVTAIFKNMLARAPTPFLNRGAAPPGDYQLPGNPVPGGLIGTYYNDSDLSGVTNGQVFGSLSPVRQPYARRQENINFSNGSWEAVGPAGDHYYSVRWTGAVYLKLSQGNYTFTISNLSTSDNRVRIWVGKTQLGTQIIDQWGTAALGATSFAAVVNAAALGAVDGWYPIVVEFMAANTTNGPTLSFTAPVAYTDPGGTAITTGSTAIPLTSLSAQGVWEKQVRLESHYDQLIAIGKDYGYQFSCEPMSLESGEFPGRIVPKARYGRDTEYIVNSLDTADMQDDLNAEEVCDALLADAQGLADPSGSAQLTAEVFNFSQLDQHLFILQEYEQQNDITVPALLVQRLTNLLALRGAPWEQIAATPRGQRQMVDSFPLTGAAAEFAWIPGDGVRLALPELSVKDTSPRQILGVQWPIRPAGIGVPSASFRQRPRDFRRILRDMIYGQQQSNRYYQGQLVIVTGNVGGYPGLADEYSRVNLPADLTAVVSARLVVQQKSNASAWTVEVNGRTQLSVTTVGSVDITSLVALPADGTPRLYARMIPNTGSCSYQLEITVRV